jgi:hypothetical protein
MTVLKKGLMFTLGAILLSTSAYAGTTLPQPVDVDLENMRASGDLVTARTTKGKATYIGCGTRNTEGADGMLFSWAFCQARDKEEEQVTCFTFNSDLVKTIREINDSSWVTFSWTDDGEGTLTCSRMGFSTQSFYLGKHVKKNRTRNIEDDDE